MHQFLSRVTIWSVAAIAALIFVATAVLFLGAALYLALVPIIAPPLAALVVGLTGFVIAGLIILIARMTSRRTPSRSTDASPTGDLNQVAAALGDLAARELTSQTQTHPYRAFGVALIAGLAVGISPELRKILRDLSRK
jgi:hypothetical protein